MQPELCRHARGAARDRADRHHARQRQRRRWRGRRRGVQPCALSLRARHGAGDRRDLPRHGARPCDRHGLRRARGDVFRHHRGGAPASRTNNTKACDEV